jgi:Uma2 family endonuclease
VTKRKLYERVGVLDYWVVDPELDALKIYRRTDDAFVRVAELSVEHGDALTTPPLPGFPTPLADIFVPPF